MGLDDAGNGVTFESCAGFIDSFHCFPRVEPVWQIVGSVFFVVTFFSFLPQTVELVTARSSFGVEPLAFFCQSMGHFLLVVNILSFRTFDFVGFFQYPSLTAFPRVLSFFNIFFQWILFIPSLYQGFLYHDREVRETRGTKEIRLEWWKTVGSGVLLTVVDISLLSLFLILGTTYGFESQFVIMYAQICGSVATVLEVGFFVPQLWTTCKYRDGGSLSLLMMEIQGPADVCNALYMWLGAGDNWTTWLTVMVNGLEEFVLLGTCLLFKCLKARQAALDAEEQKRTMSLHASLEPERLMRS